MATITAMFQCKTSMKVVVMNLNFLFWSKIMSNGCVANNTMHEYIVYQPQVKRFYENDQTYCTMALKRATHIVSRKNNEGNPV